MRAKELDTLLTHVRAQQTVHLVGGRGLGKTTLLRDLRHALDALGFRVIRVTGDSSLTEVRYGALRSALIETEQFHAHATPREVRDAFAAELSRSPFTVIVVDDAEWLDPRSAQVIDSLVVRASIATVVASRPFPHLTPEQRAAALGITADARVELQSLSFEQVGVLAEEILGGPVSPEVTSETFAMSSGVTDLATDILRTARTAGKLHRSAGKWVAAERCLWNPHLAESVERLIAHLPEPELRLLHALALAGSLPAEHLHSFSPEPVRGLAESGLVTAFRDPHGASRIAPRPSLITDYFRQRPLGVAHFAALELLESFREMHNRVCREQAELRPGSHAPAQHADAQDSHNAGLARYMREAADYHLGVAAQAWREDPTAANANRYLDVLMQAGGYAATAADVLERAAADPEDGLATLQLALHEQILSEGSLPPASEHTRVLREHHPDFANAVDAYLMYMRFASDGLSDEVLAWLADLPEDPLRFSESVAAYIEATAGHRLPRRPATAPRTAHIPLQQVVEEQTRLTEAVRRSVLDESLEAMLGDPLNLMPGDDPVPFLVDSYVRSQILIGFGRLPEARVTLSQTLAFGDLDLRFAVLYAAMLRWAAMLHYLDGRPDIAQALLRESRGYSALSGPMPGMRPEFGDALAELFAGNREAAGASFLSEAYACYDRGFLDACWAMTRFAFQLHPDDEVIELIERLSHHPAYSWAAPLTEFARAALHQDPAIIIHLSRLRGAHELSTAAGFLEDIDTFLRGRGVQRSPEFERAASEARKSFHAFREPLSRALFQDRPAAVGLLTPRELEIAPLTATLSNREIAERLTLSVRTVENHIARAMKKLGLGSRRDLSSALSSAVMASSAVATETGPE